MKTTFRNLLAFLAMLLLLMAAFGVGAYRGFTEEKFQVDLALGSLSDTLNARVEMGNNLLTVAKRHVDREDVLLLAISEDIKALNGDSLPKKAAANSDLTKNSALLLQKLEGLQSVKNDARDLSYVTGFLPRGLEQSEQWADADLYNTAANKFNQRLNASLNGQVAKLLGVEEAELFKGGQEP